MSDTEEREQEEPLAVDAEDGGADELTDDELGALDLPAADPVPLDVRNVAIADIAELDNIRPAYHGIQGLADTMHLEGQLQPIVVRPASDSADHGRPFELLFGHRRKRAAELLGWDMIRAEVRDANNETLIAQMIVENYQRENLSSVAEANAMHALKYSVDPPMTNAAIARTLGCDPSHVSHRLKMIEKLALPPEEEDDPELEIVETVDATTASEAVGAADEQAGPTDDGSDEDSDNLPTPIATEPAPAERPRPRRLDILALVDQGVIDGSTAEVIASLDTREDQEKLARLCVRNEWGVKKAAAWARAAKRHELDEGDDDVMGAPVEMLHMEDVTDLQRLNVRADLTDEDYARVTLYALLRNGMDAEMLDYLAEQMGYPYENIWDYVASLDSSQVDELTRRMAVRYISAAHRFFDLEPTLKDQLGLPEEASDNDLALAQQAMQASLPGAGQADPWAVPALPEAASSELEQDLMADEVPDA
jgi:ParB/RepB/Spo0J family partition protein